MRAKRLIALFFVLLLTACATTGEPTTANYERMLQKWVGSSEDQLVAAWGPPVSTYITDSGSKLLTFGGTRGAVFLNGMMIPVSCITTFMLTNGVVTNWRWQGNGCRAKANE